MTDRLWIAFFGVAGAIAVIVGFIGLPVKKMAPLTQEQILWKFQQDEAEMNRRSAVEADLRTAEKGFILEMKSGELFKVCFIEERKWACDYEGGHRLSLVSPPVDKIERVIRPTDSDWGDIALLFINGERTK